MGNALKRPKYPTSPTTLIYPEFFWDRKVAKTMVKNKKVAPFFLPSEDPVVDSEECPICFMNFVGGLNWCIRCKKRICTECYFQVRRPTTKSKCPLCLHEPFEIRYTGPLSKEEVQKRETEDEKVTQLMEKQKEKDKLPTPLREEKALSAAVHEKVKDEDFFNMPNQSTPSQPSLSPTNNYSPRRHNQPRPENRYNIFNNNFSNQLFNNNNNNNYNNNNNNNNQVQRPRRLPWSFENENSENENEDENENNENQEEEEGEDNVGSFNSPIEDFVPRNFLNRLDDPASEERMLREAIRLSLQESNPLSNNNNNNNNNDDEEIEGEENINIEIQEEEEEEEDDEEEYHGMNFFERLLHERMKNIKEEKRREEENEKRESRRRNIFMNSSEEEEEEEKNNNNDDDDEDEDEDDENQGDTNNNFYFGGREKNNYEDWISNI